MSDIHNIQIPDFNGRVLVGDTETTGFDSSDKLVEIAFVELIGRKRTGRKLHIYVDPGIEVPEDAQKVHGWDRESLIVESGGKKFKEVAEEIEQFLSGGMVVFHNAPFDVGFLDREMKLAGCQPLSKVSTVYDTLAMARKLYPTKRNTLDALSKRLGVDTSGREESGLHGALIDSDILVDVFLSLSATQDNLRALFEEKGGEKQVSLIDLDSTVEFLSEVPDLPTIYATEAELKVHADFVSKLLS